MKKIQKFLASQPGQAALLMLATILAIYAMNSHSFVDLYSNILNYNIPLNAGLFTKDLSIKLWINDLLMAIFFLLIGLELKREFISGALSDKKNIVLSLGAALGGVIVPALIYVGFNMSYPENMHGWAIPTATDIAFSLGVLSIFIKRLPIELRVFLCALAVIDDLCAILIIAIFYTEQLYINYLASGLGVFVVLFLASYKNIRYNSLYIILGIIGWLLILKSGVHATVAGVLLGLSIPYKLEESENMKAMLHKWIHALEPYTVYLILPVFAFANAGINLSGINMSILSNPLFLGIVCGLFFGKQTGVFGVAYALIKLKIVERSPNVTFMHLYGISILTGIGFTMSLFIGELAFVGQDTNSDARIFAVLIASVVSMIWGSVILLISSKKKS